MVRHIIMLAICIMFYIIGNAMALTPAERKAQFQCVLRCYRQFYNYGLLMRNTGELGLSIGRRESFDALLERFYRVLTEEFDVNMETVMNEINEAYASDEDYRIFKSKFYNDIEQVPNFYAMMRQYIPIEKFINMYLPLGILDYYTKASKFCDRYSRNEPLETNYGGFSY
ncbi:uncharacterized protein LOC111029516 isoform X3 [Myzus persicae]|uniref:uncharacterized protein LOC111029516 isoform X3 n=1 Tax=Myzus persicae TaxID=13164 RepID=UPI000B9344C8|nr:uncharacterized protein LOC111029516 isoform X3 [Myzus persicae]